MWAQFGSDDLLASGSNATSSCADAAGRRASFAPLRISVGLVTRRRSSRRSSMPYSPAGREVPQHVGPVDDLVGRVQLRDERSRRIGDVERHLVGAAAASPAPASRPSPRAPTSLRPGRAAPPARRSRARARRSASAPGCETVPIRTYADALPWRTMWLWVTNDPNDHPITTASSSAERRDQRLDVVRHLRHRPPRRVSGVGAAVAAVVGRQARDSPARDRGRSRGTRPSRRGPGPPWRATSGLPSPRSWTKSSTSPTETRIRTSPRARPRRSRAGCSAASTSR